LETARVEAQNPPPSEDRAAENKPPAPEQKAEPKKP